MTPGYAWWQRGVVYQIYPRSFADASGDGVGDLAGITGKLGYLQWLGVDAAWISPFYPSPMADFGYDVTDHTDVHPLFGTLADFDALVAEAHRRNIKVILDYVPNHTSNQHPWFVASRSSRDNPKRDWYLWRDPPPGPFDRPPSNWLSVFGGSAWEHDEATGQYYYHAYLRQQPDLNWRNAEVRAAMLDVLRFWLERGADGFRVDALRHLFKDDACRDNPPNPDTPPGGPPFDALLPLYTTDRPEVLEAVCAMRQVLDDYRRPGAERMLMGELYLPIDRLMRYYGESRPACHLPSNMHLLSTPWRPPAIAALIDGYEAALPPDAWPNWVLGNHDRPRIASRLGAGQSRVAAVVLLTLRGTPILYYGDELGMRDVPISPALAQDPLERNVPGLGRDPARTPMQWDVDSNAGFCPPDVEPWLPTAGDQGTVSVAAEHDDPCSMLTLYRRLIALRRSEPALAVGAYQPVEMAGDLLAYVRQHAGRRFLIVGNLGHEPQALDLGAVGLPGRVRLGTHPDRAGEEAVGILRLRGDEAVVVES